MSQIRSELRELGLLTVCNSEQAAKGGAGRARSGRGRAPGTSDPWQGRYLRLHAEARGCAKKLSRLCAAEGPYHTVWEKYTNTW